MRWTLVGSYWKCTDPKTKPQTGEIWAFTNEAILLFDGLRIHEIAYPDFTRWYVLDKEVMAKFRSNGRE